ncbi:hypothetical protein LVJ94_28420 [Pendulispora rubella]|uniref:Uncharacterized protein n=1 Tax=Pendulispora rubella TaxID=2741070 RepID=A0ABZ2KS14_9BACT
MAAFEVGIRVDIETGVSFFGLEEVNRRIAAGARVLEIRPGGAIMTRIAEESEEEPRDENVSLTLSGCQMQVILEDG